MEVSVAELFLAYRQAKVSIHQEHQGPWRLAWARAEPDLPAILARMRQQLNSSPGWFSGISPGEVWLLPKKAESRKNSSGVTRIGGSFRSPLASLTVRPHVTPSIRFAIVEVLWLWRFGAALEALLGPEARGNRLKLLNNQTEFNKDALGCFKFWPVAYRRFREEEANWLRVVDNPSPPVDLGLDPASGDSRRSRHARFLAQVFRREAPERGRRPNLLPGRTATLNDRRLRCCPRSSRRS